jgi:hypothetical protein
VSESWEAILVLVSFWLGGLLIVAPAILVRRR